MYYITNEEGLVVALDTSLMQRLKIDSIEAFYHKKYIGEIVMSEENDRIVVTLPDERIEMDAVSVDMVGLAGKITLHTLKETVSVEEEEELDVSALLEESSIEETEGKTVTVSEKNEIPDIDELLKTESTETPESVGKEEEEKEEEDLLIDLFGEKERTTPETEKEVPVSETTETTISETETEKDELLDLLLPEESEEKIEEIKESRTAAIPETKESIEVDADAASLKLGITKEDFVTFVDEYIDTAMAKETALLSDDDSVRNETCKELKHLAGVLHLPVLSDILDTIAEADDGTARKASVEAFYHALKRISLEKEKAKETPPAETAEVAEISVTETEPSVSEQEVSESKYPPIDLSDVEPIRFDFSLEEAANDLNLPVDLIEEFVHDFINQAHEETKKMIEAYQKGDLETVQKIGHLLKGTSSNLRITPLANTLYEIQFNEDIERVPELVRNYWGHFLSLENQMKIISNK